MRRLFIFAAALVAIFGLFAVSEPAPAEHDTFTFKVKSVDRYVVDVRFFSQNRRVAWPSFDRAYRMDDWREHEFALNCREGEKICYGAWERGNPRTYWGQGPNGNAHCTECCYICSPSHTQLIVLRSFR
jgi:hypothetical protein